MKKKIDNEEARRILGKVHVSKAFWLCTSENLRSLEEVTKALKKATDETFRFHVNRHKNDLELWIKEVLMDKELARDISRVKTKETLIRKLLERIEKLHKIAGRGRKAVKKKTVAKKRRTVRRSIRPAKKRKKVVRKKKTVKKRPKKRVRKKTGQRASRTSKSSRSRKAKSSRSRKAKSSRSRKAKSSRSRKAKSSRSRKKR